MKIGIFGTGDVGRVLGSGLIKHGHEVMLGSRDPKSEKVTKWVQENGSKAHSGTFDEAAKFGEWIFIATLWAGTENAINLAGSENMKGKIVIDTTNPIEPGGNGIRLTIGHTDSAGERVQKWLPDSHVIKAFNSVGNAHMVDPTFPGGPPTMFYAGNDANAKAKVNEFLKSIGWEGFDAGNITASRELEPLCVLWVNYLFANKYNPNHAFKLLRK